MTTEEQLDQWLVTLRSGKYKQGTRTLLSVFGHVKSYCCLGVLCDVIDPKSWDIYEMWRGKNGTLPIGVLNTTNGHFHCDYKGQSTSLIDLNDKYGLTFDQIAGVIEYYWEQLI